MTRYSQIALKLCMTAMSIMSSHGKQVIVVDSPLSWLQITSVNDSSFISQVDRTIGSSTASAIKPFVPYGIIVTNTGSQSLIGIDVRFTLTVGGRDIVKNFFYHTFDQVGAVILGPGQSRFFTPSRSANALAAAVQGNASGMALPQSRHDATTLRDLGDSTNITISIDLAVSTDGSTAGADRAGTVKKLAQTANAYSSMRTECLARIGRGDSDSSIQEWLAQVYNQRIMRDDETGTGDRYIGMQHNLASAWIGYLKVGRRSDLKTILTADTPENKFGYVFSLKRGLQ